MIIKFIFIQQAKINKIIFFKIKSNFNKKKNLPIELIRIISVCLETAYLVETKFFYIESTVDKVKIN